MRSSKSSRRPRPPPDTVVDRNRRYNLTFMLDRTSTPPPGIGEPRAETTPTEEISRVALEHVDEIVYKILSRDGHMRNGIVQFLSDRVRVLLGYDPQAFVDDPTL